VSDAPLPELPEGIDSTRVPPRERLDALTDDEIYEVIRHWTEANHMHVGGQFWIDELSRRRTEKVLTRIAEASAEAARHVERLAELTDKGAHQNKLMVKLTIANVVIATIAVVVSAMAIG
jgi:hypothetical protein